MSFTRIDVNPQAPAPKRTVGVEKASGFQPRHQSVPQPSVVSGPTPKPVMEKSMASVSKKFIMLALVGVVVLGSLTGGGIAYVTSSAGSATVATDESGQATSAIPDSAVKAGAIFGVPDQSTFSDDTEGVLILGGIEGEGSHTLLRPGGISQNVYLTSSIVDLNQFENARIRVWGETFKGQKAGWLMDVGRVEVLEVGAELPAWYKPPTGASGE